MAMGQNVKLYDLPFRHWVSDSGPLPVSPSSIPPPGDPWWEAVYDNDSEKKKRTARRWWEKFPNLQTFFDFQMAEWWESETGINGLREDPTNHGGGIHVTGPGGHLSVHLDYDLHPKMTGVRRALNAIAFLNPEWEEEWGGALLLCDAMGEVVKKIYPAPHRIAAFEVGDLSYHGVEKVTGPVERITAAVYYLNPSTPSNTRRRALFVPSRESK